MSNLKLTGYKNSTNLLKILVAAKAANLTLDVNTVTTEKLLPKVNVEESATNTYPILETPEGTLSQSNAILQYIGGKGGLLGTNEWERLQITSWQLFANIEIQWNKKVTVYPILGCCDYNECEQKEGKERLNAHLKSLDKYLKGKEYLVGTTLSVADIELWVQLKHLFQIGLAEQQRKNLCPNVEAWFIRVSNNSAVLGVYGPTLLGKTPLKAPKIEKTKEKAKEKKEEKKEKPAEEEEPQLEKKKVDPRTLIQSNFNFDQFKKDYSNSTDKKSVLDKLWSTDFDAQNFSLWKIVYEKIDDDGKELWKTENLRDMTLQKIEDERKFNFAVYGIYGEPENHDLKGVWICKGNEEPEFFKNELEFYTKTKLDITNPEHRQIAENYWLNKNKNDVVDGQKVIGVVDFK